MQENQYGPPRFVFSFTFHFGNSFLLSLAPAISAQDTALKTVSQPPVAAVPMATPAAKNKETSATAKARIEQKKALGISLLVSLANDARNYQDQKLRARTLSRIADALWEPDPEQGRALFRKAWDAADAADQETARKLNEERRRQQGENPDGPIALGGGPDLRAEVLRPAAKRDRALGEELLDKFKEARKQEATDATSPSPSNAIETPAAIKRSVCAWQANCLNPTLSARCSLPILHSEQSPWRESTSFRF